MVALTVAIAASSVNVSAGVSALMKTAIALRVKGSRDRRYGGQNYSLQVTVCGNVLGRTCERAADQRLPRPCYGGQNYSLQVTGCRTAAGRTCDRAADQEGSRGNRYGGWNYSLHVTSSGTVVGRTCDSTPRDLAIRRTAARRHAPVCDACLPNERTFVVSRALLQDGPTCYSAAPRGWKWTC
jgi:hypothetical protein